MILAAGQSKRTSTLKQLYKINKEYLINRQIKTVQSYGYRVAVVLGYRFDEVFSVLREDVKVVRNKNYKDGMFSSVKVAFAKIEADRLIFCHVDRPIVDRSIFEMLIKSKDEITTTFYNNKKAPPIMIQYSMKNELLNSKINRLDLWIESTNRASTIAVEDERVHFNANTDELLEKYFG